MYAAASMALQTVRTTNALAIIPSASGAEMPAASWDGSAPQAEVQAGAPRPKGLPAEAGAAA